MKTKISNTIIQLAAGAAVLALFVACTSDDNAATTGSLTGKPVNFGAAKINSKVSYATAGPVSGNSWTINWDGGESVYIYCPQAYGLYSNDVANYALYTQKGNSTLTSSTMNLALSSSSASTLGNKATGIRWGEDEKEHTFYSLVYSGGSITKTDLTSLTSVYDYSGTPYSDRDDGSICTINFSAAQDFSSTETNNNCYYATYASTPPTGGTSEVQSGYPLPFLLLGQSKATLPNSNKISLSYNNIFTVLDITVDMTAAVTDENNSDLKENVISWCTNYAQICAYIRSKEENGDYYDFRILGGDFYVDLTQPDRPLQVVNNSNSVYVNGISSATKDTPVNASTKGSISLENDEHKPINMKLVLPLTEEVDYTNEIIIFELPMSNEVSYYIPITLNSNIVPGTIVPVTLKYDAWQSNIYSANFTATIDGVPVDAKTLSSDGAGAATVFGDDDYIDNTSN